MVCLIWKVSSIEFRFGATNIIFIYMYIFFRNRNFIPLKKQKYKNRNNYQVNWLFTARVPELSRCKRRVSWYDFGKSNFKRQGTIYGLQYCVLIAMSQGKKLEMRRKEIAKQCLRFEIGAWTVVDRLFVSMFRKSFIQFPASFPAHFYLPSNYIQTV